MPATNSPSLPNKLAQQILAFIADNNLEQECHLGEERLATHFKVSRTPIRTALEFLSEMGIVEKQPNKGYFVKADSKALVSKPLVEEDTEDPNYYRIAEDRLAGILPERISERELMRRYGMTKSRLTNLLRRMSQEAWIERLPGKGWELMPILTSEKAYDQMYQLRMLIEPAALLQTDFYLPPGEIARLRDLQQTMLDGGILRFSHTEIFQIGSQFHETLVSASGNPFFIDAIQRMNRLRRLLDYRTHRDRSRFVHTCKEHLQLLDLIEAKKLAQASEFLRIHVDGERRVKLPLTKAAS